MAKINNDQLVKLTQTNKVGTSAINITGSTEKTNALSWSDEFIVQGTSDAAKSVKASVLQDFFSGIDIATGSTDGTFKLLFSSASGQAKTVYADDDTLTWNPDSELLTVAGTMTGSVVAAPILSASAQLISLGSVSGSGTLHAGGVVTFGNGDFTVAANGDVDINGGAIDGTAIGASSQSTIKATTISGSGQLSAGDGIQAYGLLAVTGAVTGSSTITADGNIETRGSFVIGNADIDETDFEKIDGITNGAGAANKALVLDANADIVSGLRNVTIAGDLTVNGSTTTIDTTHLAIEDSLIEIARGSGSAGTRASNSGAGIFISGTAGNDISLVAATDGGRLKVSGSTPGFDTITGGTYAINGTEVLSATALTIGDAAMSEEDLEKLDDITNGTVAANKAVVVDGSLDASGFNDVSGAAFIASVLSASAKIVSHGTLAVTGAASFESHVSGAGNLDIGGEVQFDGVVDTAAVMADTVYFRDADDGLMKRDSFSDIFALADGDGVQVNSGVISVPLVEHVYLSASSQHSHQTGAADSGSQSSVFTLGGNNYDSGIVTASFDVYLNGLLQTKSGSWDGLSATASNWDYLITGSGTQVLFERREDGDTVPYQLDDDDVVHIKYLVK